MAFVRDVFGERGRVAFAEATGITENEARGWLEGRPVALATLDALLRYLPPGFHEAAQRAARATIEAGSVPAGGG